ncbi:MAG: hypothetical protein V2B18_22940 [Pseudomonadota bacterium]
MKKLWTLMLAGLLIAAFTAPALAWEFHMKGEFEFRYRYLARMGAHDLFGNADIAQNLAGYPTVVDTTLGGVAQNTARMIGFAGPIGNVVRYGGHSLRGSDAAYTEQRMELNPEIRVNQAIRWRGIYGIQGTLNGNWFSNDGVGPAAARDATGAVEASSASNMGVGFGRPNFLAPQHNAGWWFVHSANLNAESPMTSGAWRASWITAQTPWGIIAAGRRPSGFGLGWSTLHERDVTTSSVAIVAPYGPLTIILSHHLHDSGEDAEPSSNNGAMTWQTSTDQNEARSWESAYAVRYTAGNVDLGTLSRIVYYRNTHTVGGPYDRVRNAAFAATAGVTSGVAFQQAPNNDKSTAVQAAWFGTRAVDGNGAFQNWGATGDVNFLLQVTYLKYNNGRFFFNGEYDFEWLESRRNGARPVSGWTNAWMLELGTVLGPTKFTLAHFFKSGHDRRAANLNVGQALGGAAVGVMAHDQWTSFLTFAGADECMKPYQFILGIYGGGNNSYDVAGYPTWGDFVGYAARIDYAVAANLNTFVSGLYALRQSNTGTYIGQYGANGTAAGVAGVTPNVPDDFLGIEVNAGVDWKLLEGLTFNGVFGVWQPGPWFLNAYRDYTYTDGGAPSTITTANQPIQRFIDPIMAFQGSLMVQF